MTNTDFFDDDLIQHRDSVRRIKMGPADEVPSDGGPSVSAADGVISTSVSDFNLTRMAKHKDEVESQVARAMQQLERLRQRQEDLEKEKGDLQDLRRKQDEYERGKKEMLGFLNQSLLTLEKDEVRAEQLSELLAMTRKRFKAMLAEIESFDEETWEDKEMCGELEKALAVIEDARMEYNKAMAKVQSVAGVGQKSSEKGIVVEQASSRNESFGHWLKVGFAVTLPLMIVVVAIAALFVLFLRSQGLL